MFINFIDLNKKKRKIYSGFSLGFFLLGPIYLLIRKRFIIGSLLCILYYWLLPFPGLDSLVSLLSISGAFANIILYFRSGLPIFLGIGIILFPHIYFLMRIEAHIMKRTIDKIGLLPATSEDANKLAKTLPIFKDLPVHPSYVKAITFLNSDASESIKEAKNSKKNQVVSNTTRLKTIENQKQAQLETIYEKYNSGFISREELLELQKKIIES